MKFRKLLLLSIVFVATIGCWNSATAQNRQLLSAAEKISGDSFTVSLATPKGAQIYAVKKPNRQTLTAIDQGLTDLFAVAAKHGYRKHLNYSDYTIFIAKADRTQDINKQYSPDIAVGAAQYAGSVYDKGGYIYAAGMVVSFSPSAFVIAEHTKNFQGISEVVRYEGEHLVLYYNDRRFYNQTADHSQGGGHPILQ